MMYLLLFDNKLNGTIPEDICRCVNLRTLDLSKNQLNGNIPASLRNCKDLIRIKVSDNKLSGHLDIEFPVMLNVLSDWITNLPQLQLLDLSNNNFSGRLPSNMERLLGFSVLESGKLSDNTLYEDVQINIKGVEYNITYVLLANTIFDLSNNNFIGEIPPSMGNLSNLRLLNLSGNHLEGKVPASLSEISTLEQLDLAKNNLSGEIPQKLSKLTKLASLNVSYNILCGHIPQGTQFDTFNTTSFQGNKCLCDYPLHPCEKAKNNEERGLEACVNASKGHGWLDRVDEHVSLIALGLGIGIGFNGVVTLIIMWDKAWQWMVPPKKRTVYGVYRSPN
jgi:hypothetical protein